MDPKPVRPRKPTRHTGERLGSKLPMVEAAVLSGMSVRQVAASVGISPHTARAVAKRLRQRKVAAPEPVEQLQGGIAQRFAYLANQSLDALTAQKLTEARAVELLKIADIAAQRAGLVDPSSNGGGQVMNFLTQYNIVPSHSASCRTIPVQEASPTEPSADRPCVPTPRREP